MALPADQLERIDREVRARRTTRSAIMSQWLEAGSRQEASLALDAEITAYYATQTAEELAEDAAIARVAAAFVDADA